MLLEAIEGLKKEARSGIGEEMGIDTAVEG